MTTDCTKKFIDEIRDFFIPENGKGYIDQLIAIRRLFHLPDLRVPVSSLPAEVHHPMVDNLNRLTKTQLKVHF